MQEIRKLREALEEKQEQVTQRQDLIIDKQDQAIQLQSILMEKQDHTIQRQDLTIDKQDQAIQLQGIFMEKQDHAIQRQDLTIQRQDLIMTKQDQAAASRQEGQQRILANQNTAAAQTLEALYWRSYQDPLENARTVKTHADAIPVVFICDESYALPTSIAITSLFCNKQKSTAYAVKVLGMGLSVDSIGILQASGSNVEVIPCKEKYSRFANSHPYVSEAALLKFDIPNIFAQYEKMIYLDSDVLILDDLKALFQVDLDDCYAAAVKDLAAMVWESWHTKIGLSAYFNSGVMLLNLKKLRGEDIPKLLLANKENEQWKHFMDQGVLNQTFAGNIVWLQPKYNLMYTNNMEFMSDVKEQAEFYNISFQEMQRTNEKPTILHLTNRIKPWNSALAERYVPFQQYRVLNAIYRSQNGQDK